MVARRDPAPKGRGASKPRDDVAATIDAFRRITRAMRVTARQSEAKAGLSAAQVFLLSVLASHPGASVNDLAAATMTDRSSAAAVVDRLVERGLAVREQSTDDRRRASVSITSAGRRAMQRASVPPPAAALIAGVRALSREQQRGLAAGLTALARSMGVDEGPAGMLFEDSPQRRSRPRSRRRDGR